MRIRTLHGQITVTAPRIDSTVGDDAAAYWLYNDAARVHASISSRTRFATIFERFSKAGRSMPSRA